MHVSPTLDHDAHNPVFAIWLDWIAFRVAALVEAQIKARIDATNIQASQKLAVIRDVFVIANGAAAARMAGAVTG